MEAEYQAFREKVIVAERFGGEPQWLDPYGATAIDEFFAVACEAYFVNRPRFEQEFRRWWRCSTRSSAALGARA
jgi:Mlc titration factor MtfA (ptsG expression regulator)